jgi:hypothetical protein
MRRRLWPPCVLRRPAAEAVAAGRETHLALSGRFLTSASGADLPAAA